MSSRWTDDAVGDLVLAAGAVVWRSLDGTVEVALVHRPKYDDWSLPKGKSDAGEHLIETALREVQEETGHDVVLGRPLGASSYIAMGQRKRVVYWAARVAGGSFAPHQEIDALEWHVLDAARDRVHRDADRAVLDEFGRGPRETTPVVILRHAKAVSRKVWQSDDEQRPLSPEGVTQASRLPGLLRAWRPARLVSSPARRCLETVVPYDMEDATTVTDDLTEETHSKDPLAAPALLHTILDSGGSAVVCSHRPVLPALIEVVRKRSDVGVDLDLDRTPLRPAEMLVAHVSGRRVVAVERQRP